ncbi:SDR family NAD(P)-dependent oxidoreductase [Streptomyces sp. PSAA01]|uniref:SDR family NAD(P)-dependent oxidoreductase n=1 Tax=Streptomyces sp. PSAA01 TaxID=2912762 RepID=UPI001F193CAB|nr:SDR family NAD(P)-dependent oxidoreductase [Streptomyces sp. PSAA01]MCG0291043.1 SDR family oxidoreductase [Streptomyces sp. PSAA01]
MLDLGLEGRTVLVTGATGAIGRAAARAFAEQGARVALAFRYQREAAEALAAELSGPDGGRAFAVPYALDDGASPRWVVAAVEEHWGGLDVLVAAARRRGVRRDPHTRFEDVPEEHWRPLVADGFVPAVRTVQWAVAGMRKRGWGRIALVASAQPPDGAAGGEFHAVARAGLHGLVRGLAGEVGGDGVLINAVCPGPTPPDRPPTASDRPFIASDRPFTASDRPFTPPDRPFIASDRPPAAPEEIARALVFLCSAANGTITGEALTLTRCR